MQMGNMCKEQTHAQETERDGKWDGESDNKWNGAPYEGLPRVHSATGITAWGKD